MKIDREHIKQTFENYTREYNLEDPKIFLKYEHTFYVSDNAERIAKSLNLSKEDIDIAWLLGIFHDIGRFEQVRRYGTFRDAESVNHAALSADILFKEGLITSFLKECPKEKLLEKAVRYHNVYKLPEELTDRERLFSEILRDADKVDILRVNCQTPREDIYNLPTEAFTETKMSDEVFQSILNHEEIDRRYSKTGIDFIMGHIGFVYGLVFEESKKIMKEQGYLDTLLDFQSNVEETQERLEKVRNVIREYLG